PVLGPGRFVVARLEGAVFAVADRLHAAGVDAQARQVLLRVVRAALAEGHVVLTRPAFVAVAFDRDLDRGVLLQPVGVGRERVALVGPDVVLVEVEEDVLQVPAAVHLLDVGGRGRGRLDGGGGRGRGGRRRGRRRLDEEVHVRGREGAP